MFSEKASIIELVWLLSRPLNKFVNTIAKALTNVVSVRNSKGMVLRLVCIYFGRKFL